DIADGPASKVISAPTRQRITRRSVWRLIQDSLLAHRMNLELLCGVADFVDMANRMPVHVAQRNAEILVTVGLLERTIARGDVAYVLTEFAKDAYWKYLLSISDEYPSWYAEDVTRRAAVFLTQRVLNVHGPSHFRLIYAAFEILWHYFRNPGITKLVESWGHPRLPSDQA
ncbi:MAG TPA: hypothetical protein VHF69_04455, partial [Candidatus Synoicihabitans sp.]|nr:hypothetical protein [Candidatus Synoicihabitans sp.]